jgi:phenylacetate-CoA ligase
VTESASEDGKARSRAIYDRLPTHLQALGLYWRTLRFLKETQHWDEDRLNDYQVKQLRRMLQHCAANVPYYRKLFRQIGFDPGSLRQTNDLAAIPTLDKEMVRANAQDLLAENIPESKRKYYTTGGTMGKPLGLYGLRIAGWLHDRAFMETQWARVGFSPTRLRAMLRGAVIKSKSHWKYNLQEHAFMFSNFHMTARFAANYADVMKKLRIPFLHTYPSAALDFARLLKEASISPPCFEAILLSSENLYPGQREAIQSFYRCRVFSWYGHGENLVLAGECEVSHNYHVFPEYGFAEILKEDERPATEEGETGELVGTSLFNPVMPLLRYRTSDWAVLGPRSCDCGRRYRLLKETRGRWLQEMLVGKLGNRISITALNMHSSIFDNVQQFQFHQWERGKAELRLIRKPSYSTHDTEAILNAFKEKMGDTIDLELRFVGELPLTERGKFRFIVQSLPQEKSLEPEATF